jgi:serine/threonine protein kinase
MQTRRADEVTDQLEAAGSRDGAARPDRPSSRAPGSGKLTEGSVFAGRYRVGSAIGDGACGTVYAAQRLDDGTVVALKVIHSHLARDPQVSKRFLREASILRKLDSPCIARIHDSGQDDAGLLYIALDLVDGEPLSAMLARDEELPIADVVRIVLAICEGLSGAHTAGVIHRDLKPDNVMVRRTDAGEWQVRLLDFGLSKTLHAAPGSTHLTEQNMLLGTPEYMAPEQARGDDIDARCDVYSAGVLLHEMLAWEHPFARRSPLAVLTAHLTEPPPDLSVRRSGAPIPPALAAVAHHALAKKRSERYPNAAAMADALRLAVSSPLDVASVRPPPAERDSLPYRDTDRFSAVHADTLRAALRPPTATGRAVGIPPWVVVSLAAAIAGVLVGMLVALRC